MSQLSTTIWPNIRAGPNSTPPAMYQTFFYPTPSTAKSRHINNSAGCVLKRSDNDSQNTALQRQWY